MTYNQLKNQIDRKIPLEFGELFSNCFELFKKVWLQGLLLQLLNIAVSFALLLVFYIPMMLGMFVVGGFEPNYDPSEGIGGILLMIGICILYVGIIIGTLYAQIALQAAFYKLCRVKDRGHVSQPGVGFGMYLRKPYFKKILTLVFVQLGILIAAALLCMIPILYAIIPVQFIVVFFAFHPELSIRELIELSFKLGTKKWGISFLLLLLMGLVIILGTIITCYLGYIFIFSSIYLPIYIVYKEMVGFHEDDEVIASLGS